MKTFFKKVFDNLNAWWIRNGDGIPGIFVAVVVGLLVATICFGPLLTGSKTATPPKDPIALVCDPGLEKRTHNALAKWVYDHSTRTSRATCNEIVFEVMKTKRPLLILAIAAVESEFNPTVTSPKGALGLMQVMPGIWEKDLVAKGIIRERRDLLDVGPSIAAGDYVLGVFLKESRGDVTMALEKYLGGRDGMYVKRILTNLASLYLLVESMK